MAFCKRKATQVTHNLKTGATTKYCNVKPAPINKGEKKTIKKENKQCHAMYCKYTFQVLLKCGN